MAGPERSSETERIGAVLDARGLQCPMPVLKARKRLATLPRGAMLSVMASDPAARIDMAHFCATSGHVLLSVDETAGTLTFLVRKDGSG